MAVILFERVPGAINEGNSELLFVYHALLYEYNLACLGHNISTPI